MRLSSTYMKKGIKNIPSASMLLKSTQIQAVESFHQKTDISTPYSIKIIGITDENGKNVTDFDITAATFSRKKNETGEIFTSDPSSDRKLYANFKKPITGKLTFSGEFFLDGAGAGESDIKFFVLNSEIAAGGRPLFMITVGHTLPEGFEIRPVYCTKIGFRVNECIRPGGKLLEYGKWHRLDVQIDTAANTLKFFINGIKTGLDTGYSYFNAMTSVGIMQSCSNGGFILISDKIYPIIQGAIYIIPSEVMSSINPSDEAAFVSSSIFIPKDLENVYKSVPDYKELWESILSDRKHPYRVFDYETTAEIDGLFKKISYAEGNLDFYTDALLIAYITELFALMCTKEYHTGGNYPKHISSIMKYINENLCDEITLDSLCKSVHLSKSYACSSFKSYTNMTITQYIMQSRLAYSKKLLLETEDSISDIAMHSGFSSFSFYCQFFKKTESCTPLQFRKLYNSGKREQSPEIKAFSV